MGLFNAEMSSDSYQLLGMAETGLLPKIFMYRSRYDTPTVGILASAIGILIVVWIKDLGDVLELLNLAYAMSVIIEWCAFLAMRKN